MRSFSAVMACFLISTSCFAADRMLLEGPSGRSLAPDHGAPLETTLPHSVWHPVATTEPWRSITFTTDARMHVALPSGGAMLPYTLPKDGDSVLVRPVQGKAFLVRFSPDRRSLMIDGRRFTLQPHLTSRFSSLVRP